MLLIRHKQPPKGDNFPHYLFNTIAATRLFVVNYMVTRIAGFSAQ
jgi:hypothetical protein